MDDSPVNTETSASRRRAGKTRKYRCDAECQPLFDELIRHGASKSQARSIAVAFWNTFGAHALDQISAFHLNGWSISELIRLIRNRSVVWRQRPQALFDAERRLERAGLPTDAAHICVMRFEQAVLFDEDAVRNALETYRSIGVTEETIRVFAERRQHALIASPDVIHAWSRRYPVQNQRIEKITQLCLSPLPSLNAFLESVSEIPVAVPERTEAPSVAAQATVTEPDEEEPWDDPMRLWRQYLLHVIRVSSLVPAEALPAESSLQWIWNGSTNAMRVLEEITRWVMFPKKRDATSNSPVVRFLAKLCIEEELNAFLRLDTDVAHFRIATLRRFILPCERCPKKDFLQTPHLLLLPWETLKREEIRYRANRLTDLPKMPCHQQTVPLFFIPRIDFDASVQRMRNDIHAA